MTEGFLSVTGSLKIGAVAFSAALGEITATPTPATHRLC
jgi:hypothetical protein